MFIVYFKKAKFSWAGFLSWLIKLYSYLNLESTKDNFAHAKNQVNLDLVLGFIFEQMVVNYQLVGKEIGMLSLTFILPLATEAWSIS